jgi:serine/threonine protein kinase
MKVCPKCRTLYLNDELFCTKDGEKTNTADSGHEQAGLIGTSVGNYKITALIGEGGMGRVYRAEHPALGRTVAIKVLNSEYAKRIESVERFFLEAKAINKIGHDNIIDVLDFGQLPDSSPYYVMEFLQGSTLTEYMERHNPSSIAAAAEIIYPVLIALQAAHEENIIHRDLKPDNIFLAEKKRNVKIVKLLDFGVAKLLDTKATNYKTRTGAIVGTPFYMSPEQVTGGDVEIDARADVYSAGLIFYEMLTGKPAFDGKTVLDIFQKRLTENPIPPQTHRPEIPEALSALVLSSIERDRKKRIQSASEFANRLEEVARQNGFPLSKSLLHENTTKSLAAISVLEEKTAIADYAAIAARKKEASTPSPEPVRQDNDLKRTTLTRSSGELHPPKPNNKKLYIAAGGLAAGGLLAIFAMSGGAPKPTVQTISPKIVITQPASEPATEPVVEQPTSTAVITDPIIDPLLEDTKKTDPKKLDPKKTNTKKGPNLKGKLDGFNK